MIKEKEKPKSKFTRSGLEIIKLDNGGVELLHHAIVSITTTSLNKILELFPKEIRHIEATGTISRNIESLKLKEVGAYVFKREETNFLLRNTSKQVVLLKEWIKKLKKFMKEYNIPDATTQKLRLDIKDKKLLELAHKNDILIDVKSPNFILEFNREHCDGEADRGRFLEHSYNQHLLKNFGFKYEMLNCKSVYAVDEVNSIPKIRRSPIIEWQDKGSVKKYFSPLVYAKQIRKHLQEFGTLKFYVVGDQKRLVLTRTET